MNILTKRALFFVVICFICNIINSNSKCSASPFEHYLGEYYQGGIIFHLWIGQDKKEHGLIVSIHNQDTSSIWSNPWETIVKLTDDPDCMSSLSNGSINTKLITSQKGHDFSAAKSCTEYKYGGYKDWYLPGIFELSLMYRQRGIINFSIDKLNAGDKITNQSIYLSSSDSWTRQYYGIWSSYNSTLDYNIEVYEKKNSYPKSYVRAIRRF